MLRQDRLTTMFNRESVLAALLAGTTALTPTGVAAQDPEEGLFAILGRVVLGFARRKWPAIRHWR
ncbi:MAG: hypothetical protein HC783_09200 [Rhodobacteraceae bacterium]|nr:hypothetical protein [Paracoccaceae bacterium]